MHTYVYATFAQLQHRSGMERRRCMQHPRLQHHTQGSTLKLHPPKAKVSLKPCKKRKPRKMQCLQVHLDGMQPCRGMGSSRKKFRHRETITEERRGRRTLRKQPASCTNHSCDDLNIRREFSSVHCDWPLTLYLNSQSRSGTDVILATKHLASARDSGFSGLRKGFWV